jgi:hypothetical protein
MAHLIDMVKISINPRMLLRKSGKTAVLFRKYLEFEKIIPPRAGAGAPCTKRSCEG